MSRCSLRSLILATVSLAPMAAMAAARTASLPTAGQVVSGSASLASRGATLTIEQTSMTAIIDWGAFSIGSGATVSFDNGSGATLNEVTGGSASAIEGRLTGTGSVYLINANGVIFGKTGVVRTGGSFVASTLDPSRGQFLKGGALTFAGTSQASVVNLGRIGSLGGDVTLIAATVRNQGEITARDGDAGLLAGYRVLVRDKALDDGRYAVLLGGKATSVTNAGVIAAANAELRARDGNVYALAGNTGGVIDATGVKAGDGHVWLVAAGGALDVGGRISAQGADGAAGAIETSGRTVSLGKAAIDAHGGTWLLDPYNLEITPDAADTISTALATSDVTEETTASGYTDDSGQGVVTSGAGNITLDPGASIAWTSSHTLTLQAYNNLILNGAISLATGTLDLTAGASIAVNAPINVSGAGAVNLKAGQESVSGQSVLALSFTQGDSIDYGPTDNGGRLSINGQAYTLLYLLSEPGSTGPDNGTDDIAGIDNNTAAGGVEGYYALATSVTQPSGQVFTGSLAAPGCCSYYLQAVFEGLGNAVNGLTILDPTKGDRVSLFGNLSGGATIRDLLVLGGSVTLTGTGTPASDGYVAGILANNNGTMVNDYSSVAVTGGQGDTVGGVVGMNYGGSYIINCVATGAISGGAGAQVGGLDAADHGGAVIDSYATGSVSGGSGAWVGGLVGDLQSSIIDSYATGAVSGGSHTGGLAGDGASSQITGGYYDANTTGQALGTQSNGSVGLTTAALQGALPSGFSTSVWGRDPAGGYPFLLTFGPPAPIEEVITGVAFSSLTGGALSGVTVDAVVDGTTVLGSATTSATGLYTITLPPGTLAAGETVVVYLAGAGVSGDTAADDIAGASLAGFNLYGGALTVRSPDSSLSALVAGLSAGLGTATKSAGSDIVFSTPGGVLKLTAGDSLDLILSGETFAFDQSLNLDSGALEIASAGPVSQSAGTIAAATLEGSSQGGVALTASGNQIAALGAFSGPGSLTLADASSLAITGVVDLGSGTLTLDGQGTVGETGAGAILAAGLAGTSAGGAAFGGANQVAAIIGFTNSGAGGFTLDNAAKLTVSGAIDAGTGDLTLATGSGQAMAIDATVTTPGLLTLDAGGSITEGAGGALLASSLTGAAAGGAALAQSANQFATLADFTDTGGALAITDGSALTVTGAIDAGTGALTLQSGGVLTQGAGASLTAGAFSGASVGGATLTQGGNQFASIAAFANTGGGDVSIADGRNLSISGPLDAGSGALNLQVAGRIVETGSGSILAGALAGASVGGAVLDESANQFATLASFVNTGGGALTITDGAAMTLAGAVDDGAGALTLQSGGVLSEGPGASLAAASFSGSSVGGATLTQAANQFAVLAGFANTGGGDVSITDGTALAINGTVANAAGGLTLDTDGALTEGGGGSLVAASFTGASVGGATLARTANRFAALASFVNTGGGDVSIADGTALSVTGDVDAGAGALTLDVGGVLSEGPGASLSAASLTGASVGGATLGQSANAFATLAGFTNTGGGALSITDGTGLTLTGAVADRTGALTLEAGGVLTEKAGASLVAASFTGASVGGATLARTGNQFAALAGFTDTGGGDVSIVDGVNLTVAGLLDAGAGGLNLQVIGTLAETPSGSIVAGAFSGSSVGGANLTQGANQFASLAGFVNVVGGNVSIADGVDFAITGLVDAGSQTLSLTGAGSITESGVGAVEARRLTGSSVGGATFGGANVVQYLSSFANSGAGGLALTDGQALVVDGAVDAGSGDLTLATAGVGQSLIINSRLTGDTIALDSSGTIVENAPGVLIANAVTGRAIGVASLRGANNQFASVAGFTTSGGNLVLVDTDNLAITGLLDAGARTLNLIDAGTVTETGSGAIDASSMTGRVVGAVTLGGANMIRFISGGFAVTGTGGFTLTDGRTLGVSTPLTVNDGDITLTTTSGNLSLYGLVSADEITLVTAGEANQPLASGQIVTALLNVTAQTGITLKGAHNAIAAIGADTTASGANKITL